MAEYLDDPNFKAATNLPIPDVLDEDELNSSGRPQTLPASELTSTHFDIVIVGAGVVGASLAYALGRSGRKIAVIERDWSQPDRIVGELLQPGGVRALACLGLLDSMEGIEAAPVTGYQVYSGKDAVTIPYPMVDAVKHLKPEARGLVGPNGQLQGRAFHHGRFVSKLRSKAIGQPNVTCIEATVQDLEEDPSSGHVTGALAMRKIAGKEEQLFIQSDTTIISDGIFSKFRYGYGTSIKPQVRSQFIGFELEHAPMPQPYHGHVVMAESGPVLLYQIAEAKSMDEDTPDVHTTRILIDFPNERLSKAKLLETMRHKVAPYLPGGLEKALLEEIAAIEEGTGRNRLRGMPNSFLPPSVQGQSRFRRGCLVVGDAMNMRHPLGGGGMTAAFWDVVHLTNILHGKDWAPGFGKPNEQISRMVDLKRWDTQVRPALLHWHWSRKNLASVINILALALYGLFAAQTENLAILREGCFRYFQRGGQYLDGPIRLLSGTTPSPALLVFHFFNVALYTLYMLFFLPRQHTQNGKQVLRAALISEYPALVYRSFMVMYTACTVFLPIAWSELKMNRPDFSSVQRKTGDNVPKDATGALSFGQFMLCTCLGIIGLAWYFFDPARYPETFASSASSALNASSRVMA